MESGDVSAPVQHLHVSKEIEKDWQLSREARLFLNCLFRRKARIQFGLLEQPEVSASLLSFSNRKPQVYSCKLLLYGKAGVGKSSTVSKLSGRPVPQVHHETIGIQTTSTYWPAKLISEKEEIVLLHLEFWDAGEKAVRKFDHIIPSMLSSANTIAFFFSYTDRSSWNDLPGTIRQATLGGKIDSHLRIVIGTKLDSDEPKVTQEDTDAFQKEHDVQVLSIANVNGTLMANGWPNGQQELGDITCFLNMLTELVIIHQTSDLGNRKEILDISNV